MKPSGLSILGMFSDRSFTFYFLQPNEINTDIISLLGQAGLEEQVDSFRDQKVNY